MSEAPCTTVKNVRTCLSRGESIGAALNSEAGLISLAAIVLLVLLIFRNIYRNSKRPPDERRSLVEEPADILMLSLFTADMLQGVGAAMNIRWADFGYVEIGHFCTAQGVVQQLGETSVAMTTLSIALQTFVAVWFRKFVHSRKLAIAVVAFIWTYVGLFVGLAACIKGGSNYYVPTPYWCWVGERYPTERIFGEYLWLWLTLFVSILVYVPIFLWGNGYLSVDRTRWWRVRFHKRPRISSEADDRDRPPSISLAILGYPVVYSILILPLSICRWISFNDPSKQSSAATFAVIFIFGLSGAANVILLLITRPNLLLFDSEPVPRDAARTDVETAGKTPQNTVTKTRGRTTRRRVHEKGRMVTPSRSSSRHSQVWHPSQAPEDEFELGSSRYNASLFPSSKKEDVRESESISISHSSTPGIMT